MRRHCTAITLFLLLNSAVWAGDGSPPRRYYAHDAVEDRHGVIAPWYSGQNGQMDFRVSIAAETLKRYPWTQPGEAAGPAPHFLYNGQWQISDDGTISIPKGGSQRPHAGGIPGSLWRNGDLVQRTAQIIFAMEEYYRYSGDPYAFGQVKLAADYILNQCLTGLDHPWPGIAVSCPTRGEIYRDCDPHGFIQLDIVAEMGVALIHAYKMTGERAYLDTALRWGELFAEKRGSRDGGAPWPRYANPEDVPWGSQPNGNVMTGGVSFVLALLDELITMQEVPAKQRLVAAREAGEKYLREQLLPHWVDNPTWGYNYWDNLAGYSNQNVIYWTVRYILMHRERFPNWQVDARNLMTIMLNRTSPNPTGRNGVYSGAWVHTESASCCGDTNGYGPQRTCGLFLEYARETDSKWAREVGRRMAILSSYDIMENGVVIDGLLSHKALVANRWFKIAVLNPIVYFIRNMALLPEHLAPNRENHLLHTASTVQWIRYGDGDIEYQTCDAPTGGADLLRLAFLPERIEADGEALREQQALSSNGYCVRKLVSGDVLVRIRHDGGRRVRIRGEDPQVVVDTSGLHLEGQWALERDERDFGGDSAVSSHAGATVTATFTGNQVRLVGRCAPGGGQADVYVDGKKQVCPVDCWAPWQMPQQILYSRNGLPDGQHTIKVVVAGRGNPAAGGAAVYVDAVQFSAARGNSGFGEGGGPTCSQHVIFGYPYQREYEDSRGNRWRPATEVVCPTGTRVDSVAKHWWTRARAKNIAGTSDPELYRYGMHGQEFTAYLTVGPGRYDVRIRLAETRSGAATEGTMSIAINGRRLAERLNIQGKAGGPGRALDLHYEDIQPHGGVIEIWFSGDDGQEAIAQAVEILPVK